MRLHGVGVSDGEVVAPVVRLTAREREPVLDPVVALARVASDLEDLAARNDGPLAEILQAQAMLAQDPELAERVGELAARMPAERAIREALAPYREALAGARSEYQRERAHDVDEIGRRAIAALAGRGAVTREPPTPGILVAPSLTPADTGQIPVDELLGVVSGDGGRLSHAAIVSRALGIPAVVAVGEQLELLTPGRWVALDGARGSVELLESPPKGARVARRAPARTGTDHRRAATADGIAVTLLANVGALEDAAEAARLGAEGCGLVRTELLFAGRAEMPAVDEQAEFYDELLSPVEGPVIVRALDAGSDKPLAFLPGGREPNPALGRRGIRLLLDQPQLLVDQVRALCRCRHSDRISLMLPMVTVAREVDAARSLLEPVFVEAGRRLPLGAMIEVPVAALAAGEIARTTDFLSVGTNDLIQYLFAADRSQAVADDLVEPLPQAFWVLLAHVFQSAERAGIAAGVCGELAADAEAGGVLWALGARSLSVSPPQLPDLKDRLAARTAAEWRARAAELMSTEGGSLSV